MPIYDQSYRTYDGVLRPRFRWITIVKQELRVLLSRRMFIFLVLLGNFHVALRIIQVYVLDVASKNPVGEIGQALSQIPFEETGAWVYFDFLRFQSPLIFITMIYAGSGLICNDFRNNLMEIYFSKPIRWRDYVIGKVMTLVVIGMALTAVPALLMALLHVIFDPSQIAFVETARLVIPIVVFSLLLSTSFALTILACSALINSSRLAGVSILMLTLVNVTLVGIFAVFAQNESYMVLAFPVSLNHLGEVLFQESRYAIPLEMPWFLPAAFIAAVCGIALSIVCRKVRRAETGQ